MIDKFQIVKCTTCREPMDEATQTILYSGGKPFCVYCHPLSDELPREKVCAKHYAHGMGGDHYCTRLSGHQGPHRDS